MIDVLKFVPFMITPVQDEGVVYVDLELICIIETFLDLFPLPLVHAFKVVNGILWNNFVTWRGPGLRSTSPDRRRSELGGSTRTVSLRYLRSNRIPGLSAVVSTAQAEVPHYSLHSSSVGISLEACWMPWI
jgi:hypothetical protein